MSKSTFLIRSSNNRSFGTGFCIYKNQEGSYLLTAAHVVESCGLETLLVDAFDEVTQEIISYPAKIFQIADDVEVIDLAVIYVQGLTNTSALKISNEIREFNAKEDTFEIDGFRSHKNMFTNTPLKGYIKKSYQLQSQENQRWIYDLVIDDSDSIVQGYSGSAIVCSLSGLVLGIATDRNKSGKQAYAIPAYYLKYIWKDMPSDEIVEPLEKHNPYKGLSSFAYKDKHNYYGRKKESQEIAKVLKGTKLFTLLGASGSGKSSLIFAGIVPLIEEENIKIVDFRPQDRPFKNLASIFISLLYSDSLEQIEQNKKLSKKLINFETTLDDLVANLLAKNKIKHLYIIIDQFEELFTLTKNLKEKNCFLDQLLTLINSQHSITILLSMRADFLSQLSYYEPFNKAFNEHKSTSLSLLSSENLIKVIEEPSRKLGVRFQEGLVDRIIDEIENEAGQLPLLEFALEQFWNKRKGRFITHEILDDMKSISHSISHYADNIYEKHHLHQKSIKKVLIKLVNPGSGTEDTRRVASFDDFDEEEIKTIQLLASERLVVTKIRGISEDKDLQSSTREEQSVDIVHEALLREWKRLRDWIDEYREFLLWEKKLRDDRVNYFSHLSKNDDKNLLTDSKLLRAKEFLKSHEEYIASKDKEFILKSIEVDRKRRRNFKIFLVSGFVFLLLVIAVIWYFFKDAEIAKNNAIEAKVETKNKLYDNIVQQGLTLKNHLNSPLKAKMIFAKAVKESNNKSQEKQAKILYNSVNRGVYLKNIFKYTKRHLSGLVYSKDEREILSWNDNTIRLWDKETEEELFSVDQKDTIGGVIFNKDNNEILSWDLNGTIQILDKKSGKLLFILNNNCEVLGATLSKDSNEILYWDMNGSVKIWDRKRKKSFLIMNDENALVLGASFNKNEKEILSWDTNSINGWDRKSGKSLFFLPQGDVLGAIFSKDEKKILNWVRDDTVQIWERRGFKPLLVFENASFALGAIFSKDEKEILSWSEDGTVKLLDKDSGKKLLVLKHDDIVYGATFSKDEKEILSWSEDGTIRVWDKKSGRKLYSFKHNIYVNGAIFSKDEKEILSWSEDGTIKTWKINNSKTLLSMQEDNVIFKDIFSEDEKDILFWSKEDNLIGERLSKDETEILSWSYAGVIKVWDKKSRKLLFIIEDKIVDLTEPDSYFEVRFSQDQKEILRWSSDGIIKMWDKKTRRLVLELYHSSVIGVIFSKNGKEILSWGVDGTIRVWDKKNGNTLLVLKFDNMVDGVTFSRDDSMILSWSYRGVIKVWNRKSGKEFLCLEYDNINGAKFSKDENEILSWTDDGIVNIYKLYRERKLENKYYPLEVEVENGVILSKSGELEVLKLEEWIEKKKKYEAILKNHIKDKS
jgi:WD40 repeat protein/energy-coupling factor transporter ATP-binding protein EcfA2